MDRNAQRLRAKEVKIEQAKRLDQRHHVPLVGHVAGRDFGPRIPTQIAPVKMIPSQLSTFDCKLLFPPSSQHDHKLNSFYLIENKGSGSLLIATKMQMQGRPFSTLRARISRTPHSHRSRACTIYSERREASEVEASLVTSHFSSRFCHEAAFPESKTWQADQPQGGIAEGKTVRAPGRAPHSALIARPELFCGQTRLNPVHPML